MLSVYCTVDERQFKGGGSVVVNLLSNVLPIVCGSSVFVFVLPCIS